MVRKRRMSWLSLRVHRGGLQGGYSSTVLNGQWSSLVLQLNITIVRVNLVCSWFNEPSICVRFSSRWVQTNNVLQIYLGIILMIPEGSIIIAVCPLKCISTENRLGNLLGEPCPEHHEEEFLLSRMWAPMMTPISSLRKPLLWIYSRFLLFNL